MVIKKIRNPDFGKRQKSQKNNEDNLTICNINSLKKFLSVVFLPLWVVTCSFLWNFTTVKKKKKQKVVKLFDSCCACPCPFLVLSLSNSKSKAQAKHWQQPIKWLTHGSSYSAKFTPCISEPPLSRSILFSTNPRYGLLETTGRIVAENQRQLA